MSYRLPDLDSLRLATMPQHIHNLAKPRSSVHPARTILRFSAQVPTESPTQEAPPPPPVHPSSSARESVEVSVISFTNLFVEARLPLAIDSYQRPYVWGNDKTSQLLDDLSEFGKRAIPGLHYYMGTILLHWDQEKEHLFVIDGQQRLTTLSILHKTLCQRLPPHCELSYRNPESWKNIKDTARLFIDNPSLLPSGEIFDHIQFTVIIVSSEDLAFTFFDTQNNRGVPLNATDLLKAYHLRAIANQNPSGIALQKSCAARWEGLQNAPSILGSDSDFAPSLFQYFLWRGRCWTGRQLEPRATHDDLIRAFQTCSIESASSDTIPLYSSRANRRASALTLVPQDGYRLSGEDIHLNGNPAELPFAIRQPVSKGVGFFLYADKYAALAGQLLNPEHENPEVQAFRRFYQTVMAPLSTYLRELFLLACVMYVDQFGYRQFLRFALWLDYALGAIRIEKAYIFKEAPLIFLRETSLNLLDVIASAFRPEEPIGFLKSLPEPLQIYATRNLQGGGVQARYQQSVLTYYGKLGALTGRHHWIEEKLKSEGLA